MSDSQAFEAECFWEKEQFGVKKGSSCIGTTPRPRYVQTLKTHCVIQKNLHCRSRRCNLKMHQELVEKMKYCEQSLILPTYSQQGALVFLALSTNQYDK